MKRTFRSRGLILGLLVAVTAVVAGCAGEVGPRGTEGASGSQGSAGAVGPTGSTGPEGPLGPDGPQGPVGPEGPSLPSQLLLSSWTHVAGERASFTIYGSGFGPSEIVGFSWVWPDGAVSGLPTVVASDGGSFAHPVSMRTNPRKSGAGRARLDLGPGLYSINALGSEGSIASTPIVMVEAPAE